MYRMFYLMPTDTIKNASNLWVHRDPFFSLFSRNTNKKASKNAMKKSFRDIDDKKHKN